MPSLTGFPFLLISFAKHGPNFMALFTVSTESARTEAGNYVLTASVIHGLVTNLGFCACVRHASRHFTLTRLAEKHVKRGIAKRGIRR